MINLTKGTLRRLGLVAAFCLAPLAFADDSLRYTGGGVYPGFGPYLVGPYNLSINGAAAVQGICDDVTHTVPGSTPWPATRHDLTAGGLVGTRYYDGTEASVNRYFQVAYLGQKLLNATDNLIRGYIQWAIWDTFNAGSIGGFSGSIQAAIGAYKTEAVANASAADGIGWSVYTPIVPPGPQSQEFLVKTPEPAAVAILTLNLSALLGLVVFFRRRMVGDNSRAR